MEEVKREIALANNPDFIQQSMWPLIVEFADILKEPNMSAHSIMSYFLYGNIELWAAIKDEKPTGFTCFQIAGPPYYSTGIRNFIFMKEKDEELVQKLYEAFADFLKKNNLKYFMFHSQNKKMGIHLRERLEPFGLETLKSEYIHIGKRRIGSNYKRKYVKKSEGD